MRHELYNCIYKNHWSSNAIQLARDSMAIQLHRSYLLLSLTWYVHRYRNTRNQNSLQLCFKTIIEAKNWRRKKVITDVHSWSTMCMLKLPYRSPSIVAISSTKYTMLHICWLTQNVQWQVVTCTCKMPKWSATITQRSCSTIHGWHKKWKYYENVITYHSRRNRPSCQDYQAKSYYLWELSLHCANPPQQLP